MNMYELKYKAKKSGSKTAWQLHESARKLLAKKYKKRLKWLAERRKRALYMKKLKDMGLTLAQVGKETGVSAERVRAILQSLKEGKLN